MTKQRLYLFVGYPGAGKTTIARLIAEATGAVHVWADKERHDQFGAEYRPEHSDALYERLNRETDKLLASGKSVVFDTNFNYYRDRENLRRIADEHDAETVILWVKTPKALAYHRAITQNGGKRLFVDMSHEDFERVAGHLEPPRPEEHAIEIDGTHVTPETLRGQLGI